MISISEKMRAPSRNAFRKGPLIRRTRRVDRGLGGPKAAHHHEATAGHLRCFGSGEAQLLRRDGIPKAENFPESEQLERRALVADLATNFDVRGTTSETLRLRVGLEDGDELVLDLLRLGLVHSHNDEVEVHFLDAVLRLRLVRHGVDVDRATGELVDVIALLEVLDGIHELGVAFDFLTFPKLNGGLSKDLVQPVEVHTLSPFVFRTCYYHDALVAGLSVFDDSDVVKNSILQPICQAKNRKSSYFRPFSRFLYRIKNFVFPEFAKPPTRFCPKNPIQISRQPACRQGRANPLVFKILVRI